MRLTDLADYLRSQGLVVVETAGWKTRGTPLPGKPDTIICHHTATPERAKGDLPTLRLLIDGREDLPGPLCQLALSRSGVVHVIAGGKANHAGKGTWRGQSASSRTIGIEAEHPGGAASWSGSQYDAYVRLCAALCRYLEVDPNRVCAHKEWAQPKGRKVDVNFDMDGFRSQVRARLSQPVVQPKPEEDPLSPADREWLTKLIDDRVRILLRAETADGKPTGHDSLKAIRADIAALAARVEQ